MPLLNMRVEQLDPHSASDRNRLVKFPFKLYKVDPYWVPPLIGDRKKFLDPKHNPSFEYLHVAYFMAEATVIPEHTPKGTVTGGMEQDVGMIAAIVNPRHNEIHGDDIGFFGLFECINSQQVADALLDAAATWLRGQGRTAMRGPLNFTMTDEVGLLIDGFDDMPRIMMPYNPPYYPELLEGYGLAKTMDLYAYHLDMIRLFGGTPEGLPPKLTRVVEKLKQRGRMTIHKLDMKQFDAEVEKLKVIYNSAWEKNWGAVGITDHELAHYAAEMKPVLDPDLAFFIEVDGKSVGVALCLPDANLVLKKMNGRVFPFGFIQALRYQKRIQWVRVWALGVLPDYRHLGVDAVIIHEVAVQAMRKGMPDVEASWILESNVDARRSVANMGGEIYKTYRVYEMEL
jgi:GNAT superfamily N-acetyltransferase